MKKILLLTLPLMVMCFASCEKDKGNDETSGQKLVKEISWTEDDYQEQFMFEYDENARVINVTEIVDGNAEGQYSVHIMAIQLPKSIYSETMKQENGKKME